MSRVITPEDTKAFWNYMSRKRGSHVVSKSDAAEMQIAAASLALMGIMDAKKFLSNYSTTIVNRIYVPFEIGGDTPSLAAQVATCVHEHVHVRQFRDMEFVPEYCLSSAKRAALECDAYRATMEMMFWMTGNCPSPKVTANLLRSYACTQEDIDFSEKYLRSAAEVIKKGGILTPESKIAIKWLMRHTKIEAKITLVG